MDRRKPSWLMLAALVVSVAGCTSSANDASYELVEAPKARADHETRKAASGPGTPTAPVLDTTQLNQPPATAPEVKVQEVKNALAEAPVKPEGIEVASLTARDASATGLPKSLEPLTPSPESVAKLVPNKIELKVPQKVFRPEGRERALRVSYDDLDLLKVLNMEPVPLNAEEYLPAWLKGLNGEKVRLKGWMFPPLQTEGLPAFLFVRDNQICCFGREAKVYDKVRVMLKDGETTDYIFGRPFDVVGTFHIESEEQDGQLYFLYSIDDATVMK
jgi:hypothetical protein